MAQSDLLAQIRCSGREVYIGAPNNATWIKLSVDAFRTLVANGREAFDRACGLQGSLFHVNDAPNSATIVRIGDQIHIGTANVVRYVELSQVAVIAIFNHGLQILEECFARHGNWLPLYQQPEGATTDAAA